MEYYKEKEIVVRLIQGLSSQTAASFLKREEECIHYLLVNDLVKPNVFRMDKKVKFGIQNLAEADPLTAKGKALFGSRIENP